MPIAITAERSKLDPTVDVSVSVIAKPIVEGADYFEVSICADNLQGTAVTLTDISITSGSPTVTGLAPELANVKIGSVLTTAGTTSDFAGGTYVTAKPTATTLTVSTNALRTQANITGSAQLTVDATLAIVRLHISSTGENIRITPKVARMDGTKSKDANGNGVDDVAYTDGVELNMGVVTLDYDTFAQNFGLARTNS